MAQTLKMNPNNRETIAAVIVTYNRLEKLKISITKTLAEPLDFILVVNNNSTDGTCQWLNNLNDPRLIHLRLDKNSGGSGGFYSGIKYILENIDANWILLFDDDAYPAEGHINHFYSQEKDSIDIIATRVLNPVSKIPIKMNMPAVKIPKTAIQLIKTFFKPDTYRCRINTSSPICIEACSFVGCYIRTTAIKKYLGLPDPSFFIYCDDLIYTYGAKQKGGILSYHPSLIFYHDCNIDNKRIYNSPWKAYYLARNYFIFYKQVNKIQ
jgi:hypothetical protein